MNKKIISLCLVLLCGCCLVSCNKIQEKKSQQSSTTGDLTPIDKALDNISDELKGVEITQDDIQYKDTVKINKITSERYQGEISQKEAPHGNKIEVGIVTNDETGEKYSLSDLFDISDEFVSLIIDRSNSQLDDISTQFTSNFSNDEWKSRLENVAKDESLSYFIFNDSEQLEIYFDVPPAYGSFMKIVALDKLDWINFVKDKNLF